LSGEPESACPSRPRGRPTARPSRSPARPRRPGAEPSPPRRRGPRVSPARRGPRDLIAGSDARGALYGVGHLLRQVRWAKGALELDAPLDVSSSPAYPIRGHQLGYRSTANSWDAWTVTKFEQYIRELALFGVNSIENIPFQDDRQNPLMKVPRREMNRAMSEICARYGLITGSGRPPIST
jgi:hypothetical protein